MLDQRKGFAVQPKLDCPDLKASVVNELIEHLTKINQKHFSEFECGECKDKSQNWVCLECKQICCSRYVNSHMVSHNASTQHPIALSFSDSSFWCYNCESYIDHPSLIQARKQFSKSKFALPVGKEQEGENEEKQLAKELEKMAIKEEEDKHKKFTFEELTEGLKNKKYKNVIFLTGAGMSVASGIPDFRSPGTGLYSQLEKYKLPRPESVFELDFFSKNPVPFMKLAKQYLSGQFKPTPSHFFIKKFQEQGILLKCMTQNIDDLEVKAGVEEKFLLQAHGHSRTAHCIKCKKQAKIEEWLENLKKEEEKPLICSNEQCGGFVKPDIVFFGEQLPADFHKAPKTMEQADLVFIIGTSLAVMPFAFLAQLIPMGVPVVLINNTDSLTQVKDFKLWMQGDIQENVQKIAKEVGWKL